MTSDCKTFKQTMSEGSDIDIEIAEASHIEGANENDGISELWGSINKGTKTPFMSRTTSVM